MFFTGGHFALRRRLWYNKAIHYKEGIFHD